jgi:hypothetical protein
MRATRWDALVTARACVMAVLAFALAWLITVATDEGGVPWGERAGRTLPLIPFCAAIGVWGALAPVRARGEALALEALGRTRGQIGASAVAGALVIVATAALLIATLHSIDLAGYYPTATHRTSWRWDGDAFVDAVQGLRVGADGQPSFWTGAREAAPRNTIPPYGRAAAALVTAVAGVGLALLAVRALLGGRATRERMVDIAACVLTVALTIVLFQAATVHAVSALAGVVPPILLLALAVQRYRALS